MINFVATVKKNPQTKESKWYAQVAPVTPVTLEDIAERITANCTVTEHDVKAVLSALQEQVIYALRDGKSVRLGDLGSFRLTLSSVASDTAEAVTASSVKSLRVRFTSGARLSSRLKLGQSGIHLARVDSAAAQAADAQA